MSDRSATLYRIWNSSHSLLYVGITADIERRMDQHASEKAWWNEVWQVTTEQLPSMRRALEAEARAIFWEQPRYNVLGSTRYSTDWEAKCHALEESEATRLAMPGTSDEDCEFLSVVLARVKADVGEQDARRLAGIILRLERKAGYQ